MNLLQKIRSPFTEAAKDPAAQMRARQHSVGAELRERREHYGLDLDSVGETLRIKPAYLDAIEQGRPQDLPGPAYALGFVRAYANYLGLDAEQVMENFKAESIDAQARPDLALPVPLGARSVPGGAILIVGLILALCGYGTWYYLSTGERNRPERVAAVPAELQQTLRGAPLAPTGGGAPDAGGARFGSGVLMPQDAAPQGAPPPGIVASPAAAALPGAANPAPTAAPGGNSKPGPAGSASPSVAATGVAPPANPAGKQAAMAPPAAAPPTNPAGKQAATTSPPPVPPAAPPTTPPTTLPVAGSGITPASTPPAEAGKTGGGRVEIRATADCWIQVRAAGDQSIVFSRVLKAGETYPVPRDGLFLRTGNAGVLTIMVDGRPAPAIGGIGTLRRNVSLDPDPLIAGKAVKD